MNLRNNQITIGEILSNPQAKRIAQREFSSLMNPFMLGIAKNMTLQQALGYAGNRMSQDRIQKILEELKAI
ncbi:hypothetical protein [Hydrogenoanaerobacterium sp.]|uniref:hypothetical protein n=1 Tax=Hydrogenoanaerobacterium sp. TaxID=2953763 RepID=UPI002896D660|nr:hypothetical protein [Hydrogenoanaerobacterium sp.]